MSSTATPTSNARTGPRGQSDRRLTPLAILASLRRPGLDPGPVGTLEARACDEPLLRCAAFRLRMASLAVPDQVRDDGLIERQLDAHHSHSEMGGIRPRGLRQAMILVKTFSGAYRSGIAASVSVAGRWRQGRRPEFSDERKSEGTFASSDIAGSRGGRIVRRPHLRHIAAWHREARRAFRNCWRKERRLPWVLRSSLCWRCRFSP